MRILTMLLVMSASALSWADSLTEAINSPDRPDADRSRDATSLPADVLRFAGIQEGNVVLDLFAGTGYYSEIIARTVGPDGKVYLHNNAAYLNLSAGGVEQRLAKNRLPNVVRYDRELDAIELDADSVDLVVMVLAYHDLYYKTEGWDLDPESFFTTIHRILKPGGTLLVVDHIALPDSGKSAAQDLHRIDPEYAKRDIESRGFQFAGELEALKNDVDPLTMSVFDDSIRHRTSRFVYKFVEPTD